MSSSPTMSPEIASAGTSGRWLSPTGALERFDAPRLGDAGRLVAERTEIRYGYRIGRLGLLVKPGTGTEVVPMVPVAKIPNSSSWMLGLINLRGNLVPVFDLKRALQLEADGSHLRESAREEKPMVLVFDKGEKAIALTIDGYPRPLTGMRRLEQVAGIPDALARHSAGAFGTEHEVWLEFDNAAFIEQLTGQRSA